MAARGRPKAELVLTEEERETLINQVERWFAELTRQLLERGDHRSVHALERDIRAWVADWNANPKPFVWTKTAEQILQSIHRLMKRINGAGH